MSVPTQEPKSPVRAAQDNVVHPADTTTRQQAKGKTASQRAINLALHHLQRHAYQDAVAVLKAAGHEGRVRDLLGVCLMRAGEFDQAKQLYRQLVLVPNSVYPRPEINDACKRNYATALLLAGLPSGALEVLAFCCDVRDPRAVEIRAAIKRWEQSLSWFRRWDWKLNRIEPPHCSVPIEFEAGEL